MTDLSLVDRYFACINDEDWEGFVELWVPNAEVRAVGTGPRQGIAEVTDFYRGLFSAWRRHRDTPTRVLPSGDAVTVEVRFEGETPDGRALAFDAVDVFDLGATQIQRLSTWYDLVLVRQLLAERPDA